jgi:hypothetical protein
MRIKKKFVTIKPKTLESERFFETSMLGLQSCELLETTSTMYHLKPIKTKLSFWVKLKDDVNWEIEK